MSVERVLDGGSEVVDVVQGGDVVERSFVIGGDTENFSGEVDENLMIMGVSGKRKSEIDFRRAPEGGLDKLRYKGRATGRTLKRASDGFLWGVGTGSGLMYLLSLTMTLTFAQILIPGLIVGGSVAAIIIFWESFWAFRSRKDSYKLYSGAPRKSK